MERLYERARIGYLSGIYEIFVWTDDTVDIPHIHIWDKDTNGKNFHTCVRLDKAEYINHSGANSVLSYELKRELNTMLSQFRLERITLSYWEYIIIAWNCNNSYQLDQDIKQPDYTKLK